MGKLVYIEQYKRGKQNISFQRVDNTLVSDPILETMVSKFENFFARHQRPPVAFALGRQEYAGRFTKIHDELGSVCFMGILVLRLDIESGIHLIEQV